MILPFNLMVMGNMMLAAHTLGVGSCWIHRAKEEFEIPEQGPEWGDANCDLTVDIADAVLICRYVVQDNEAVITNTGKYYADVTHDEKVDLDDAEKLLQFIAKKLTHDDLYPPYVTDKTGRNIFFSEVN